MFSTKKREELIIDYLSDTLNEVDLIQFNKLYKSDSEFAMQVDECVGTYAEIINWQQTTTKTNDKEKQVQRIKTNTKNHLFTTIKYAAAVIVVAFITLFFTRQYKTTNNNTNIITKTDTVYLPKKEYYQVHHQLLAKNYIPNSEMDELVALSNQTLRGTEICTPIHNSTIAKGEIVKFNLTKFKPGTYRIELLGFQETIDVVDTLYSNSVKIYDDDKMAYKWIPENSGVYYWMVYVNNKKAPFLVRKLNVRSDTKTN